MSPAVLQAQQAWAQRNVSQFMPLQPASSVDTCRSEYARSEMGDGSAVGSSAPGPDELGPECDLLPDLPPSWVPQLAVARDMMDMRCPRV